MKPKPENRTAKVESNKADTKKVEKNVNRSNDLQQSLILEKMPDDGEK